MRAVQIPCLKLGNQYDDCLRTFWGMCSLVEICNCRMCILAGESLEDDVDVRSETIDFQGDWKNGRATNMSLDASDRAVDDFPWARKRSAYRQDSMEYVATVKISLLKGVGGWFLLGSLRRLGLRC